MTTRKLDDTKWSKIYSFLRITPHIYTGNEQKVRVFIEAVYWVMRTGAATRVWQVEQRFPSLRRLGRQRGVAENDGPF